MTIIGLEINDSGILAAAGNPPDLIDLDGQVRESPGFALPQKKGLLVGKTAESKAHLFPRQVLNHFWDQLNTESLEQSGRHLPLNHAEVVYRHLSLIWEQIRSHGDEVVMAVPSFFDRRQLGLILGIAQELGMPLKGFVPLSLAASDRVNPGKMLMFLDIHLHRIEAVGLEQENRLTVRQSDTAIDKGLHHLYRGLVEMIAQQFVRLTRFDPFHQANSEQELYDRLPGILSYLQHNSSMIFEIAGRSNPYSINLHRDDFIQNAEPVYNEVLRLIQRIQSKLEAGQTPLALQLSHRLARLPGCIAMLNTLKDVQIIELDQGAAARGVCRIWDELEAEGSNEGISFFTSRPWQAQPQPADQPIPAAPEAQVRPTHLLHGSVAYPITDKPLTIGCNPGGQRNNLAISSESTEVSTAHCTVALHGGEAILKVASDEEAFVDEQQIHGSTILKLGQIIRIGSSGDHLQLIACIDPLAKK